MLHTLIIFLLIPLPFSPLAITTSRQSPSFPHCLFCSSHMYICICMYYSCMHMHTCGFKYCYMKLYSFFSKWQFKFLIHSTFPVCFPFLLTSSPSVSWVSLRNVSIVSLCLLLHQAPHLYKSSHPSLTQYILLRQVLKNFPYLWLKICIR